MSRALRQKKENRSDGNFQPGYVPQAPSRANVMLVPTPLEIALDEDMRGIMSVVRGEDGDPPSRGYARMTYNEGAKPWRTFARYFAAARRKRTPKDQLSPAMQRLARFLDDLYADAPDLSA